MAEATEWRWPKGGRRIPACLTDDHLAPSGLCLCSCPDCTAPSGPCVCPDCRCEASKDHAAWVWTPAPS